MTEKTKPEVRRFTVEYMPREWRLIEKGRKALEAELGVRVTTSGYLRHIVRAAGK